MYYKKHNLLQIHIPKTAGTSVMTMLDRQLNEERIGGVHNTYKQWTKFINKETNVFTIIRNPWDRVVSNYHWIQSGGPDPNKYPLVKMALGKTFEEYVDVYCKYDKAQYDFLAGGEDRIHLIRFEHLLPDLARYFHSINLKIKTDEMPHIYKTNHKHWQEYYNEETYNKIKEKDHWLANTYSQANYLA